MRKKSVLEHILELRTLFFRILFLVFVASGLVHYFRKEVIFYLLDPLDLTETSLQFLSPLDPLFFILKIDFVFGILLVLPLCTLLIWRFLAPKANPSGWLRRIFFVGIATSLSALATYYVYKIVAPIILNYMASIVIEGTAIAFTAHGYLNFILNITIILVLVFQAPLFIYFLASSNIINPKQISGIRRKLYLGVLVLAAFITPTTDVFTLFLIALPAIVSIEVGFFLALFSKPLKPVTKTIKN